MDREHVSVCRSASAKADESHVDYFQGVCFIHEALKSWLRL